MSSKNRKSHSESLANLETLIGGMSLPELRNHYEFVSATIKAKENEERASIEAEIAARRSEFEAELAARVRGHGFDPVSFFKGKRASSTAAKYVNPANPSETWAGIGRKPNWLTAAIAAGAALEDFAVTKEAVAA